MHQIQPTACLYSFIWILNLSIHSDTVLWLVSRSSCSLVTERDHLVIGRSKKQLFLLHRFCGQGTVTVSYYKRTFSVQYTAVCLGTCLYLKLLNIEQYTKWAFSSSWSVTLWLEVHDFYISYLIFRVSFSF